MALMMLAGSFEAFSAPSMSRVAMPAVRTGSSRVVMATDSADFNEYLNGALPYQNMGLDEKYVQYATSPGQADFSNYLQQSTPYQHMPLPDMVMPGGAAPSSAPALAPKGEDAAKAAWLAKQEAGSWGAGGATGSVVPTGGSNANDFNGYLDQAQPWNRFNLDGSRNIQNADHLVY